MYISLMLEHNGNGILNKKKHLLWSGKGVVVVVVQFIHYIN